MKDKLNINIRIADQDPLLLSIEPGDEKYIREAEESVNHLWVTWKERFHTATPDRLMAMIAFQFAKLYTLQKAREKQAVKTLEAFGKELQGLTATIDGAAKAQPKASSDAPGPADHPSLL